LSRLSVEEIRQHVVSQGLVAEISGATLWRWLSSDALRPWKHRSWIFPRDPNFAAKAGPILDLYQRVWEGAPLGADDYVICADEKTSIQARRRKQPTLPLAPNRPTYVEHEYFRLGAWTYLAAWDVHRARVFGRCEVKSGIAPVNRLVGEVMGQEPYKSARRVFWIMDNCSAHRGQRAADRLRDRWPNLILIHTPVHASWLNRSKSISRSFRERSSLPTTSRLCRNSNSACLLFSPITSARHRPSTGPSPDTISMLFWPRSAPNGWLPPPDGIRHRNSERQYLATVTTLGWLGFLSGPPVIGFMAAFAGLPSAFIIVVVFATIIATFGVSIVRAAQKII
jgi:hypothetical protein